MGFFDWLDAASAGVWPDCVPDRASAGMKEAAKGDDVGSAGLALVDDDSGAVNGAGVGAGAEAEADEDDDDELNRLAQDLAGWVTAGIGAGGGGAYDGAGITGGGTDSSGGGPGGG